MEANRSEEEFEDQVILQGIDLPDAVEGYSKRRVQLVQRAVKEWTQQLVDLGGRNNLLNYRDLKQGTLDLTSCQPAPLSNLLHGRPTRISALFPSDLDRENAVRRARTIFKKASENFDERGIETLSLACGLASWENAKSAWQPHAPVLIRRASLRPLGAAQDDFELTLLEQMEVNSTLLHVLRVAFDLDFDEQDLFDRIDGVIDESGELEEAYRWMIDQATGVPGFNVDPRLVLANFAYTKLPMVRDLENSFEELVAHDLIAAIAGDEEAREAIRSSAPSPESIPGPDGVPPKNEFLILDADSSQNFTINAVLAGANLIIRGPPGTGKSQTIANLIGALAAQGKKVLFVAEKRAAIEAVLKRLRQRKLDDLVVDLHGGITSRREFAQAIGRALDGIRETPAVENAAQLYLLEKNRKVLNQYDAAVHEAREPWGLSAYEVRHELLDLDAYQSGTRFRGEILTRLDAALARKVEEDLAEYVSLGGPELKSSPWANSKVMTNEDVRAAYELVDELYRTALPAAKERLSSGSAAIRLPEAPTLDEWDSRLRLLDEIRETLNFFQPEVYDLDLLDFCTALASADRGSLARMGATLFSGGYRLHARQARRLCAGSGKASNRELLHHCDLARKQVAAWRSFGGSTNPSLPTDYQEIRPAYDRLMDGLEDLEKWAGVDDLCDLPPSDVEQRLQALLNDRSTLVNIPELGRLESAFKMSGLSGFLADVPHPAKDWVKCFRYAWLYSILEHLSLSDPMIGGFIPEARQKAVDEFQVSDRSHIAATPGRIKRICAEKAVERRNQFKDQDEIVRRQANLKRRHLPVRDLIRAASDVLLALKPCWAMSPLVVSQLLPPSTRFDVVIFDEASQITPADAIASILRGTQLVIAGDEKQLPPSAFFVTEAQADEDEEDDEDGFAVPLVAGTKGFESILDALRDLLTWRMLQWHYRSRDERLIAFSNAHIYDRMLITFPGSGAQDVLRHEIAPWVSGAVTNSPAPEVETVVELVIEHAMTRPAESLGVITMGIKHANRIEEALRERLREDPELEESLSDFFDDAREERFFVKNLERVQGDERDAIILSIGYGKNARGELVYRFGPLLQDGGERRLNVAVTRAKQRIILVSSFSSKDMDAARSDAEGVKLLRQYLQYIESLGQNLGDRVMEKPLLNPFEVDVRDSLTRKGLKLVAQYGSSGYWIDFAVQHPDRPGDYILAVECDGRTYHSTPSARDRDRLRQEQLERLGWRFCRIWSSEWFDHKDAAVAKVLSSYEEALRACDGITSTQAPAGQAEPTTWNRAFSDVIVTQRPRRDTHPGVPRLRAIQDYSQSQLVRLVRWIESDKVLRTEDELVQEMMQELGFARRGKRVVSSIQAAIRQARRSR